MDLKEIFRRDNPYKDFFEPIGELVVVFSMLETHLSNTIQILIGISPQDNVLLMEQITDIRRRIEFFEASLNGKLKDFDALAWVKDIAEDLRRANLHRNHIVHGPWNNFDPPTGKATKIKFRKNKSYFVKPYSYTAPQIREIAFNMYSIMQRMGFLMGHVLGPDMKLGPSDMKLGPSRGNCMPPCPLPD
jgi:hypothetical protein